MGKFKTIYHHLDDFDYAQAKKLVKIEGGAKYLCHRDDLFPFIKNQQEVTVLPLDQLYPLMPITYIEDKCLKLGFVQEITEDEILLSTIKGFPLQHRVNRKLVLGRVKLGWPRFIYKFLLNHYLKKEKYRLIR